MSPSTKKVSTVNKDNFRGLISQHADENNQIPGISKNSIRRNLVSFINDYGDNHVEEWFTNPTIPDGKERPATRVEAIEKMLLEWGGVTTTQTIRMNNKQYEDWLFMLGYKNDGMIKRDTLSPQEISIIFTWREKMGDASVVEHLQRMGGYFFDKSTKRVDDVRFYLQLALLFNADDNHVVDTYTLNPRLKEQLYTYRISDKSDQDTLANVISDLEFVPKAGYASKKQRNISQPNIYARRAGIKYIGREEFLYMQWVDKLYEQAMKGELWEEGWLEKGRDFIERINNEHEKYTGKRARKKEQSSQRDSKVVTKQDSEPSGKSQKSDEFSLNLFDVLKQQYALQFAKQLTQLSEKKKSQLDIAKPQPQVVAKMESSVVDLKPVEEANVRSKKLVAKETEVTKSKSKFKIVIDPFDHFEYTHPHLKKVISARREWEKLKKLGITVLPFKNYILGVKGIEANSMSALENDIALVERMLSDK